MRRLLVILVLAAAGLAVPLAGPAWACSCAVPDTDRSDLAFVGVVTDVEDPLLTDNELIVTFAVESVEKGEAGTEVELTTAAQSPSCGYEVTEGHRYRIYAHAGTTSLCSGNEDLGTARAPADRSGLSPWWAAVAAALIVAGAGAALLIARRRYGWGRAS